MSVPQIEAIFNLTSTSSGVSCGMPTFFISTEPNAAFVFTAARIFPFIVRSSRGSAALSVGHI